VLDHWRKRAAESQDEGHALWLIVLSDMMTNLMLFFIVMYAFTVQGDAAMAQLSAALRGEPPKELEDEATKAVRSLFEDEQLRITEQQVRIRLSGPVLFESGKDVLSLAAAEPLAKVAAALQTLDGEIIVEGHTDDRPVGSKLRYQTNTELAAARARAVVERLAEEHRLPLTRFAVAAYGETRPVGDNATVEGRAANRRIEIVVSRGR
jgi:chemotaxis protein MotB